MKAAKEVLKIKKKESKEEKKEKKLEQLVGDLKDDKEFIEFLESNKAIKSKENIWKNDISLNITQDTETKPAVADKTEETKSDETAKEPAKKVTNPDDEGDFEMQNCRKSTLHRMDKAISKEIQEESCRCLCEQAQGESTSQAQTTPTWQSAQTIQENYMRKAEMKYKQEPNKEKATKSCEA